MCVCVFRMCARARCQHVFSLVCVSFRTQGSAVSSRCFVSFYSVLSDSILSWLCVEQDQIAVPPIPSPPQPTGNRQAWLPCPQAAGPVMRSEKGFGQDVWMCVLVFLIASYCFWCLLVASPCSMLWRHQESGVSHPNIEVVEDEVVQCRSNTAAWSACQPGAYADKLQALEEEFLMARSGDQHGSAQLGKVESAKSTEPDGTGNQE